MIGLIYTLFSIFISVSHIVSRLDGQVALKKMSPCRTEMSPQDKGKILAYMENFNATQITKKMERDPTTIRRFINKYKETGTTENLPRSGCPPALNNDEKDALISASILYNFT